MIMNAVNDRRPHTLKALQAPEMAGAEIPAGNGVQLRHG